MYFYKKVFLIGGIIVLVTFGALLVFMTGFSDFDASFGAPSFVEVKLFESMKSKSMRPVMSQTLAQEKLGNTNGIFGNLSDQITLANQRRKDEMNQRIDKLNYLCQKYHLGNYSWPNGTNDINVKDPPTPLYSYFFLSRDYKIAWCPVYKAGSTTWLYNMMVLKGYSDEFLSKPPKQLSVLADEVYGDAQPGMEFNRAMKMLIVRHPFERIVSAYRDKLANSSTGLAHGTKYYHEKYGKMIVKKFRRNWNISQEEPIFEEFVRYLIKTDLALYADDHWLPAYSSCTPCRIKYDFIGKVESYMDDQQFIIDELNLSNIIKPRWQHRSSSHSSNEPGGYQFNTVSSSATRYFSQLSQSQIMALCNKYFLDFELFGYSCVNYINLGRS